MKKNNDNHCIKLVFKQFKASLREEFFEKKNLNTATHQLVKKVDEILVTLFQKYELHLNEHFCLLALGSYGRQELQLYSDVDILLLQVNNLTKTEIHQAEAFIQACWDIGLELSHQLTTVEACSEVASHEISAISSLLDARRIIGRYSLFEALEYQTHPLHMWPEDVFFHAKYDEQKKRYKKYGETAYHLEPNVKYGAGGLRDIQVLLHIGKRHFKIKKLSDGIACGFFTPKEHDELLYCLHFLCRIRFALHAIAQKKEERLLFDYQIKLAQLFGFKDTEHTLGIEQFMKAYFKVIKRSRELNEMLLQWFSETIVYQEKQKLIPLDDWFQLSNGYIEVRHSKIFSNHPLAILSIFLWIAKTPEIKGVRANTIRLIRQHLYLLDKRFCSTKAATQTFMNILSGNYSPYQALQRMNRYGVLGYYLEPFAAVTGQMQYDLFHVYTVDQHTLFVIRNIGRFLDQDYQSQFPLAYQLMAQLKNRSLLYLGALFHDIAKGRGGDHSELGAIEAEQFSKQHQLNTEEKALVVWLVKNHLFMSQTAQRQDIYDPKTIHHFCQQLPHPHYLEYLYLLTVADICVTNPSLWNTWRDSLLKELYLSAKKMFETNEKSDLEEEKLVLTRQKQAIKLLEQQAICKTSAQKLWKNFNNRYFLHESSHVIAKHTQAILACDSYPLVLILPHHSQGGTEIFIYMPHRTDRFTMATTILNNHHITIYEATITSTDHGFDLDTYVVLNEQNQRVTDENQIQRLKFELKYHLKQGRKLPKITKQRLSRTQAHFKRKPKIMLTEDDKHPDLTRLFLVTSDSPGLLARISHILLSEAINLHSAKIATAGEKVEDTFYISNQSNHELTKAEKNRLFQKLMRELS